VPDKEHHEFDYQSIRLIAENVKRLRAQYQNLEQIVLGLRRELPAHYIRTGYTTTNTAHPTYPTSGCQFVVKFEDWSFVEATALCADTDKREWASKYVLARVYGGGYLAENTRVLLVRVPGYEGRRWWILPEPATLVELCLAEAHPGRGIKFSAKLGWWDPSTDGWRYEDGESCTGLLTVAAIDWRYGVPYPGIGAKGLFTPRASDTYGIIYECVSLDCESPDTNCCTYVTGS